jgi:hypothetical protein
MNPRTPAAGGLCIPRPCTVTWQEMTGDERLRHCERCNRDVPNLSAMTEIEANAWLAGRRGRVCARIDRGKDGRILFQATASSKRALHVVSGAAMFLAAACTEPAQDTVAVPPPATAEPAPAATAAPAAAATSMDLAPTPAINPSPKPRPPRFAHGKSTTTVGTLSVHVGCVCQPGDPLCSCL